MIAADGCLTDARLEKAGFAAGFTTRAQGSMHDAAARARVLEAAGVGSWPAYMHKQVHGDRIVRLSDATSEVQEADGWLIEQPGRVAINYAADCAVVMIWAKDGSKAAMVHSGWRGTKAGIAGKAFAALGLPADRVEAFISPRAGACCYAVSDDFEAWARPESLERRGGKLYFDNGKEIAAQLPGVDVALDPSCTICSGRFFSYRREKDGTRMMGFLARRRG